MLRTLFHLIYTVPPPTSSTVSTLYPFPTTSTQVYSIPLPHLNYSCYVTPFPTAPICVYCMPSSKTSGYGNAGIPVLAREVCTYTLSIHIYYIYTLSIHIQHIYMYTLYTYIHTLIYSIYMYTLYTYIPHVHIYTLYTYITIYTHIHSTHTYIILWGFVVGWLVGWRQSHAVAQASLDLIAVLLSLLPSAGITGMCHHV